MTSNNTRFTTAVKVFSCLCALWVQPSAAREVTVDHQGLRLNANLELAAGKTITNGVVLITHGALAHNKMELIAYLQTLLLQKNLSSLAINLSLALNDRHGMYDCKIPQRHRNEDAAAEIGVWVNWLAKQGAKNIVLLGHSRGGAQTALYVARHDLSLVDAVILMAPATAQNGAEGYENRFKIAWKPLHDRAQSLIQKNHSDTLLEHVGLLSCGDSSVSAASFVSYYGGAPDVDTPSLLPAITKPLLVLIAGGDEVVVDLAPRLAPLHDQKNLHVKTIESSDHLFRDLNADEAVDAIAEFLHGV